jgi:hypothetical protein
MKIINKIIICGSVIYLIPQSTITILSLYGMYSIFKNDKIEDIKRNIYDIVDGINYIILENTK